MSNQSLSVAMSLPDDNIPKPSRKQPVSLTSAIAALDVDEVAFKGVEVPTSRLHLLTEIKKGLSDSASSSARNAKGRHASDSVNYSIETAVTITGSGTIYAIAFIRRTA